MPCHDWRHGKVVVLLQADFSEIGGAGLAMQEASLIEAPRSISKPYY